MNKLVLSALRTFVFGVTALGVVLCLAAGTINYWQAWVFALVFMVCNTQQGVYLSLKDPELLERRKQVTSEAQSTAQKIFIFVGIGSLFGMMIVSALDHRFGWSQVPFSVSVIGDVLIAVSYYIYYLVFKENSFAATTIQTFEGQKVISTGMYGFVRHPKYVGDLVLFIGIPLALGSWWGLVFILVSIAGLAWRILDEEKLLEKELPGYIDYMRKVQYRLVPHLW